MASITRTAIALLLPLWLLVVGARADERAAPAIRPPELVTVRFDVSVPSATPADGTPFIAGSPAQLGGWKPDGLALRREGDRFVAELRLPPGPFEWKVTLGAWERCETNADGGERANREAIAAEGAVLRAEVLRWRSGEEKPPSTMTGDVRVVGPVGGPRGGEETRVEPRMLTIRVPSGYVDPANAERRYPVIYFLDGQNVFDRATSFSGVEWGADEAHDRLVAEKAIEAAILVGIPNSPKRMDELTFVRDASRNAGGEGDAFLRWLVDEVKPTVDRLYRTRPDRASTTLVGSSLGGLFALEATARRGDVFGRAIAMSPSLWWADEELLTRWSAPGFSLPDPIALWFDMGTAEQRAVPDGHVERARRLEALFKGRPGIRSVIDEGAKHHESAWAARLPEALRWTLGERSAAR